MLFVVELTALPNRNNQLEHVTLQLHWKYNFDFAGFIVAKEKGFYHDVGLDVTLKEYTHGMDVEDEVLKGNADYGVYNSRLLVDYLNGAPIKLLASFFKRAALVLVTQPEIENVRDLVGKRVMATTKRDFAMNFKPYFDKYGVSIDDIELVPHTYRIDEFVKGKIDAMTAFQSNEIMKLLSRGIKFNVLDPSDDNLFVMQLELFTSQKEFEQYKERTKRFVQASIKGWEYTFEHMDEIVDLIYEKYNRGFSKEDIRLEVEAVERLILPYTYEIGSINRSFLKKQARLFQKNYGIESDRSIDEYIYNPYKSDEVAFTFKELRYINEHPYVTICPHYNLFPIDGIINSKHTGIMSDIFERIAQQTGLKFQPVQSKDFQELFENVTKKRCQVLSIATPELAKKLSLYVTKVLSKSYFTIITTVEKSFIKNPYILKDEKLLMQDPNLALYIRRLYPYLKIEVEKDEKKMLEKLKNGEVYGIVTIDEQADYFIDAYGYGKLKLGGFLAKNKPLKDVIAIQKDEPVLASIIQKALYSIPRKELEMIIGSWRMTRYHKQVDYTLLVAVLGVVTLIVSILLYYQRKIRKFNVELERKVDEKTKELRELNEKLEALVKEKVQEIVQKDRILAIQSKQAIMGEMITMIAHQWRQPLNTLTLQISNLQLRRMMGELVDIDEYDKTLEQISKTITYLSDTIDDFQTFFHADRELSNEKLSEVIDKAINFILPRTQGKEISIEKEVDDSVEAKVYINELIQVLLNILNNAIDALEECERGAKTIRISGFQNENNIVIIIEDNACGIDPEVIEKLFEPYFSTKGKNGTGLGLYMSQMIMQKQFGGDVYVESSPQGSKFFIEFPKF